MSKDDREVIADLLTLFGALVLFASLFLTWSHQFSPLQSAHFGGFDPLRGVPRNPTAWQVYSAADVVLALVAGFLFGVSLVGNRPVRMTAFAAACGALVFSLHALSAAPTNGVWNLFNPAGGVSGHLMMTPGAGAGEALAVVGLLVAIAGLGLSFTAD